MSIDKTIRRDLDVVRKIVDRAARRGASFADARTSGGSAVGLSVQDGRAERMSASSVRGACVRVIVDERWGFASTDGSGARRLADALDAALAMARAGRKLGRPAAAAEPPASRKKLPEFVGEPPEDAAGAGDGELTAWAAELLGLERAARSHAGKLAANTMASLSRNSGWMTVASSHGTARARGARRSTASVMVVVAEKGQGIQRWTERSGRTGQGDLLKELAAGDIPRLAAERAMAVLRARPAPGGSFPVILDPATAGVFVHECLGHNAEADLVLSGQSLLDGKLGEKLASAAVTVVDDPTIAGAFGSYEFDSEGTPARRTEVISRGVLATYLHSLETAARCKTAPTGHGRAEGYGAPPLVRMSNTFFAPGQDRLEDMIRGIHRGILLEHGSSGQVLSERGHYTVSAGCGRLIENGRLTELVRDASFSGLVLESLKDIDAISSDFRLEAPGYCGKDGQEVPVDNGGAYVRLAKAVVGGQGKWPRGGKTKL